MNKNIISKLNNERGSASVIVVIFMLVLIILSLTALMTAVSNERLTEKLFEDLLKSQGIVEENGWKLEYQKSENPKLSFTSKKYRYYMKIHKNVAISDSGFIFNPLNGESFSVKPPRYT